MGGTQTLYQQAATTLARALCRDAIWYNQSCNWIGSSNEDYYGMPKSYAKALSSNFYDGTAGIAFFLTAAHQLEKDAIIEKTAQGALQQIIDYEANVKKEGDNLYGKLGFHTGWTGCAYVLHYTSEVFKKPDYAAAAQQLIRQCMQLPEAYWGLDSIDGAAGAISALIVLYRKQPETQLKDFILSLGSYLLAKADKKNGSLSWDTMADKTNNLTGYGHGAAGFAHAFAELYHLTGDEAYLKVVRDIIAYEDAHFNEEQQNWPDFRNFATPYAQQPMEQAYGLAWCHGAPGIGLSRLRIYEITKDPQIKRDLDIALQTTATAASIEVIGNYSMCHGLFGNAELLLGAAEILQQPDYRNIAEQLANECITNYITKGLPLPNGLQGAADTPDFMLGTSGMGYFFLRLCHPEKFPCMLLINR